MAFIVNIDGKPLIYVHNTNLGTNGRAYNAGVEYDSIDVTAFSDAAHRNILGQHTVTFRYDGLFDDAAVASHAALNDMLTNKRTVSVWPAGDGTGTEGIGIGTAIAQNYRPGGNVGEFLSRGMDISADAQRDRLVSLGSRVVLTTGTSGTLAGPDVNGGSTATAGGGFFIHVFAQQGTVNWLVAVQDSTGGGATGYANVATATFNAATGGTIITFTGSLRQFRRYHVSQVAAATTGSGTITIAASVSTR